MADLTDEQLHFLETFVLGERRSLAGLDLATPHDDAPADLQAELVTLRGLLDTLGPPDGANAGEVAEIQEMQRRAFAMLDMPVTQADLAAAGRVAQEMRAPVARIERRIRRDALRAGLEQEEARVGEDLLEDDASAIAEAIAALNTALAGEDVADAALDGATTDLAALATQINEAQAAAKADREARAADAEKINEAIKAARPAHVDGDEGKELDDLAAAVTRDWTDPPSHAQLAAAKVPLEALEARGAEIAEAVEKRKADAAALLLAVRAIKAEGADGDEAEQITKAIQAIETALPEYPTPGQLTTAVEARAKLEALAEDIRTACAARIKRAGEIVTAQGAAKIANVISAEQTALDEALAKFPDLTGTPSRETMAKAEEALSELEELIVTTTAAVAEREKFATDIAAVLATLAWNSGALVPHAEAPATLMNPIRLKAEALTTAHAAMGDAAKADSWPDLTDGKGDVILGKLKDEQAEVEVEMGRANDAATRVADKHKAVRDQIAATTVFTLSGTQQSAMTAKALEAAGNLKTDPDQASVAIGALGDVESATKALQIDLYGYKMRIDGVDITPLNASKAEEAQLKKLQTAAIAELEKALP